MGKILSLQKFQNQKRKRFLIRHSARLDAQVTSFMKAHLNATWEGSISQFCEAKKLDRESVWDLEEFRNGIYDWLYRELTPGLTEVLAKNYWFDPSIITSEWLTDLMINHLVNDLDVGQVQYL